MLKCCCGSLCWSIAIILAGIVLFYKHSNTKIRFEEFNAPTARVFDKSIPTRVIKDGEYDLLLHSQIDGIESLDIFNGFIYAADQNCDIMRIEGTKIVQKFPLIKDRKCEKCCFTLGIRHWKDQRFVLVDGGIGVVVVNFADETIDHVFPSTTLLTKWAGMVADDFDFIDNETIVFSDLTASCSVNALYECLLGGVKDGRLIQLNLRTKQASVLLDDQFGFNGVQTHADKQSVLIGQSMLSRILRYYFAGSKKGQVEVFADRLPGLVDNIRLSSNGKTYWVAFFLSRQQGSRIVGQVLGAYPALRSWLYTVCQLISSDLFYFITTLGTTSHHVFVELDATGNVVSTLHDPDGKFPSTTQIFDDGKYLYLSSIYRDYVAKVKKNV